MDFELPLEEKKLQEETRAFVDREIRPLVPDIEKKKSDPIEIVRRMARQGIYRLLVPKEFGGMYEKVRSLPICVAREELGRGHNFAGASIATQGLGSYPLVLAGSSEIRKRFLPGVAKGEIIPAFALTEPEAGSDAGSLRTAALREGDHYRINGTKCFISNAGIAQYIVLLAKTDPSLGTKGISAILVETGTPDTKSAGGWRFWPSMWSTSCNSRTASFPGQTCWGKKERDSLWPCRLWICCAVQWAPTQWG
jgi:alkylation response protein AidB-like acyl-CoA dehydrogenase